MKKMNLQAVHMQDSGSNECTHGDAVCVFLSDSLSLGFALLERMLVLELGAHFDVFFRRG